jgi:hypothetical protein
LRSPTTYAVDVLMSTAGLRVSVTTGAMPSQLATRSGIVARGPRPSRRLVPLLMRVELAYVMTA